MTKKLIIYFVYLILVVFLVKTLFDYMNRDNAVEIYDLDGYLYKNNFSLKSLSKPIIFIHLPSQLRHNPIEHREIETKLGINDAFVHMNIKSVIKHCGRTHHVVIFDNSNVTDILSDTNDEVVHTTNLKNISGTNLINWENYVKCKILYKYGGIMMSPDFFFINNIDNVLRNNKTLQILEYTNEGLNVSNLHTIPHYDKFMASPKYDTELEILTMFLAKVYEDNYDTTIMKFDSMHQKLQKLQMLNPKHFGIQDVNSDSITLNDWMSANKKLLLDKNCVCVYVNRESLHKRSLYGWIKNSSESQILSSNTNIGKFMSTHQ